MTDQFEGRQETTLRDFLNVLFARKWLIVTIVGVATLLVVYLNARQPLFFESSSRILVRRGEQANVFTGSIRYLGWAEEVSSQIQVILSDDVFRSARQIFADSVKTLGLPPDTGFQPGATRADVVGESNVFVIRYTDFNPQLAKLGCEAMTIAFQEYYRARKTPPALSDFFAEEIMDARAELEYWRGKRNEFLNEKQFFGLDEESKFLLAKISQIEGSLRVLSGEFSSQELRVRNLEGFTRLSGSELENRLAFAPSRHVLQSGIVSKIKFSLQEFNMTREELLQKYTERHPDVIAADRQIQELHNDLKREVMNTYRVERVALKGMMAERETLVAELASTREMLGEVPDKDLELGKIDARIATALTRYKMLLSRQSESEIALASAPQWEVTILAKASNAYSKKTRDYVRIAVGPFLSLIVALGLAFFLESLDHSVKNVAEVEEFLGKRVLASISEFRK